MRSAILLAAAVTLGCGAATGRSSSDGGAADMAVMSGPEANPPKLATLILQSYFSTGLAMASATATFSTYDGGMSGPCNVMPVGACRLRSCPRDSDMGGIARPPMRTNVGAGTVTLTGPSGAMPLTVGSDGSYSLSLGSAKPWDGGESFTMSATGDAAPAFTTSILATSRPRMLTPARPAMNGPSPTVTRASGLPITWKAASPGTLTITVATDTPTAFLALLCDTPASAGSYTVAPEALAALPADGTDTTLTANVANSSTLMAGDWPVTFTVENVPNDDALDLPWIMGISWQ
jgi:hypothetical protein